MAKQYKISWPFLDAYNDDIYNYDINNSPLELFYQKLAFFVFFDDIKDYFLNHSRRSKERPAYTEKDRVLNFNKQMSRDLCGYQLDSLADCIDTANQIRSKKKKINKTEKDILKRCPVKTSKRKLRANSLSYTLSDEKTEIYLQNWTALFKSISDQGLPVKFFILPEHPLLQYSTKPIGIDIVMERLLSNINSLKNVQVFDMREVFNQHPEYKICELFNDSNHLSNKGKKVLTKELLSTFD